MSLSPEVRRGGGLPFGQFVSQWACDPRYTTNLRTLYTILITYADIGARDTGKGKPFRRELAGQLGASVKTLDRILLEGECAGLFWVEKRTDPANPALNDANVYHLRDAEFWRGEWTDPLGPEQVAADVAAKVVEDRVKAKRAAGIVPKGGRKKKGVASPVTPPETGGGGVTGDARDGDTGDARMASPMTPNVYNPVQNPLREADSRPSVPTPEVDAREADRTEGRTDGGGGSSVREEFPGATGMGEPAAADAAPGKSAARRAGVGGGRPAPAAAIAATPGVELLTAIGAEHGDFRLTGDTLVEQGALVTEMLAAGWTAAQVRQVVAGDPMPDKIRTSKPAVVAWRLRQAARGPAPASVPHLPGPAEAADDRTRDDHWEHGGRGGADKPTPTPASWAARQEEMKAVVSGGGPLLDCAEVGERGACPKLAVPGEDRCAEHLGWPLCPGCCKFRARPGEACDPCATALGGQVPAGLAGPLAAAVRRAREEEDAADWERAYREDQQAADAPF